MSELVVRRLLVDLESPFARDWNGGDDFRSAFFDALSMSFPLGEQFFIDAVRAGAQVLPADAPAEVHAFIGQEATHRRIHALYNARLDRHGYVNGWGPRIAARNQQLAAQTADPRHAVAITAATEHFTAILAAYLLDHDDVALAGAEPRLRTLWLWHASEELEHRSVAFDLYRALGGSLRWRRRWFGWITFFFLSDVLRQTVGNLHRGGRLWRWRTWASGASFLFGPRGVVRRTFGPWAAYWRAGFHPSQQDGTRAADWLRAHADAYTVVGGNPSAS